MPSIFVRLKRLFPRRDTGGHARSASAPVNPVTIRTQRINRGVEEGIEKHSYRGNPDEDDKWPDQRPAN